MSDIEPGLIVVAIGIGIAVLCLMLAFGDDNKRQQAKRVDRLRQRGQTSTEVLQLRRDAGEERLLDMLMARFLPRPELMSERLRRTGRQISLGGYAAFSLMIAGGVVVMLLSFNFSLRTALLAGLLKGLWWPYFITGWMIKRRQNRFTNLFPEAIGLMTRGIKSGLPITETFHIVANEIADPVGTEFRKVTDQIRLGHPVDNALLDAAKRVGTPELKFLVVTLSIQRETGGNLAETLENLDNILRRRRQMKLKIRAMSSEARASAMIIGSLPFAMMAILSVISPEYLAILFNTHRGNVLLEIAGMSMLTGLGVMSKLVKFEI